MRRLRKDETRQLIGMQIKIKRPKNEMLHNDNGGVFRNVRALRNRGATDTGRTDGDVHGPMGLVGRGISSRDSRGDRNTDQD